jgi:hypothetical protein
MWRLLRAAMETDGYSPGSTKNESWADITSMLNLLLHLQSLSSARSGASAVDAGQHRRSGARNSDSVRLQFCSTPTNSADFSSLHGRHGALTAFDRSKERGFQVEIPSEHARAMPTSRGSQTGEFTVYPAGRMGRM